MELQGGRNPKECKKIVQVDRDDSAAVKTTDGEALSLSTTPNEAVEHPLKSPPTTQPQPSNSGAESMRLDVGAAPPAEALPASSEIKAIETPLSFPDKEAESEEAHERSRQTESHGCVDNGSLAALPSKKSSEAHRKDGTPSEVAMEEEESDGHDVDEPSPMETSTTSDESPKEGVFGVHSEKIEQENVTPKVQKSKPSPNSHRWIYGDDDDFFTPRSGDETGMVQNTDDVLQQLLTQPGADESDGDHSWAERHFQ